MKPTALNDRIRQDIESRIMSGAWEAGRRIPSEHELMAQYDCSRMTVSKALSSLADRGLIDRRKRAGSFVAVPTVHRAALDIPDLAAEIEEKGCRHMIDILHRIEREADANDREQLSIKSGPVLALDCLHRANGQPFAFEQRLINLTMVPAARDVDFAHESPGRWLLGHVPWTDAKHRILAIAASDSLAERMAVPEGSPCLSIERWTWRTAEKITYVRQVYPGDYALMANFIT